MGHEQLQPLEVVRLNPQDFYRPLYPTGLDQGDPFTITLPQDAQQRSGARFKHYTYTTNEDVETNRSTPAYGSNDLLHWEAIGPVLNDPKDYSHWAPMVRYIPHLEKPFVMLYSRSIGINGDEAHQGHSIRRADSYSPEGPFENSGHILTEGLDIDFAIDADVYRSKDGQLKLAFAIDFVHDEPIGTGIVEAPVSEDLTTLLGEPKVLARARSNWQTYEKNRRLPWKQIPNVDWNDPKAAVDTWYCVEAPVGGLVSPQGEEVVLYSSGCFYKEYFVGALINRDGEWHDVPNKEGLFVITPQTESGLYKMGHPSVIPVEPKLVQLGDKQYPMTHYLMTHMGVDSVDAPRQFGIAPLLWDAQGRPFAPTKVQIEEAA